MCGTWSGYLANNNIPASHNHTNKKSYDKKIMYVLVFICKEKHVLPPGKY